ncbi:hypothetical protein E9677_25070, partial [Rhizobium rhizophilum]
ENKTLSLGFTVTDGDGDGAAGYLKIQVNDDAPVATTAVISQSASELASASGSLSTLVSFGADGIGKYAVELDDLSPSLKSLKSNGATLEFAIGAGAEANMLIATSSVTGDRVFTFKVDPQTGEYAFTQLGPIDHATQVPLNAGDSIVVDLVNGSRFQYVGDLAENQSDIIRLSNSGNATVHWGVDTDDDDYADYTLAIDAGKTVYLNVGNLPNNTKVYLLDAGNGPSQTVVNPGHGTFTGVPVGSLTLDLSSAVTVTDGDGDQLALSGQLNITVSDSQPSFAPGAAGAVSEDGSLIASGTTGVIWGADNGDKKSLALVSSVLVKDQTGAAVVLKSNAEVVNIALVGAVLVGYTGNDPANAANGVFTVSVNKSTGGYNFELLQPLDHSSPTGNSQYLDLSFDVLAKDSDNDTAIGSITVRVDAAGEIDSIDYGAMSSGVVVNLSDATVVRLGQSVGADTATDRPGANVIGRDGMAGVVNAYGGKGNDILIGGSENNILKGGDGSDILLGGKGSDTLDGGKGDDVLIVSADIDVVSGFGPRTFTKGDGTTEDVSINGRSGEGDELIGGAGFDTVRFEHAAGANGFVFDRANAGGVLEGVERFEGTDGDDVILLPKGYTTSETTFIEIDGGKGNDILQGSDAQGDKITGGDGNDLISGLGGDDDISGGNGDDKIWGGDGNDIIRGDWGRDIIYGGNGNDTIYGGGDNDNIDGGSGDDNVFGGDGNDVLTGGTGTNSLRGEKGDDV